jgi:hypothetical protein
MHPDLERLIRLQQLDSFADEARRRIAEQPQRAEALDARLAHAREEVASAKQRLADSQAARRAVEKELAIVQSRLSKFKDQVMEVKTNREYQAMQKEIEVAQNEVSAMEDRMLERMLEADDLTALLKRAEAELAAEQTAVAADQRALAQEVVSLQEELDRAAEARRTLVAEIEPRVLATFEQVARGRKGIAVAEARDGHCTICHVRLRPQVFNEIRRNDSIMQCDSCQRFLYFRADTPGEPRVSQ